MPNDFFFSSPMERFDYIFGRKHSSDRLVNRVDSCHRHRHRHRRCCRCWYCSAAGCNVVVSLLSQTLVFQCAQKICCVTSTEHFSSPYRGLAVSENVFVLFSRMSTFKNEHISRNRGNFRVSFGFCSRIQNQRIGFCSCSRNVRSGPQPE